jgi:hypothetical protein
VSLLLTIVLVLMAVAFVAALVVLRCARNGIGTASRDDDSNSAARS